MTDLRRAELITILQEEAAEVIQAGFKQVRFGINEQNQDNLVAEIGDFMGTLKLLIDEGHVDPVAIQTAAELKIIKLDRYMTHKRQK